ncbi:MAG: hypothetical protein M3Y55_10810 [Pseudomonadota bacterium]|nr:hypothetical protein [Pseudomonadota bacterium]
MPRNYPKKSLDGLENRPSHLRGVFFTLVQAVAVLYAPAAGSADLQKVVLQNGIYTFDSKEDVDGVCARAREGCSKLSLINDPVWGRYTKAVCAQENKNQCVCDANVTYPSVLRGERVEEVNQAFKKVAQDYACNQDTAITKLTYEVTFDEGSTVSVVFDGYSRETGAGGSCHSGIQAMTANVQTGHVLALKEALEEAQEAAIRESIVNYVKSYFLERQVDDSFEAVQSRLKELNNRLSKNLWERGFYIRDRQVFINLNDYILGCAEGPSFAVPIPRQYIKAETLELLR